jgi:hypothetical protein
MTMTLDLPDLFLGRLRRLASIRSERREEFNSEGLAMIDRSLFSTFRDCQRVGADKAAREILHDAGLDQHAEAQKL